MFSLLALALAAPASAGSPDCALIDGTDVTSVSCSSVIDIWTHTSSRFEVVREIGNTGMTRSWTVETASPLEPIGMAIELADGTTLVVIDALFVNQGGDAEDIATQLAGQEGEDFWGGELMLAGQEGEDFTAGGSFPTTSTARHQYVVREAWSIPTTPIPLFPFTADRDDEAHFWAEEL